MPPNRTSPAPASGTKHPPSHTRPREAPAAASDDTKPIPSPGSSGSSPTDPTGHDLDNKAGQVPLRQPLVHRWRQKVCSLTINRAEIVQRHPTQRPRKAESMRRFYLNPLAVLRIAATITASLSLI